MIVNRCIILKQQWFYFPPTKGRSLGMLQRCSKLGRHGAVHHFVRKRFLRFCVSLGFFLSTQIAYAGFEVMRSPEVDDSEMIPGSLLAPHPKTTEREQVYLDPDRTARDTFWRLKLQAGLSKIKLKNLDLDDKNVLHVVLGGGYQWHRWLVELEIVGAETYNLPNRVPIVVGSASQQLEGDFRPFAVLASVAYEFPTYFKIFPDSVHPYVSMGAGIANTPANSQIYSLTGQELQSDTTRKNKLAWQTTLGFDYDVIRSLSVGIAYRVFVFGDVDFAPAESSFQGDRLLSRGFFVGVNYNAR